MTHDTPTQHGRHLAGYAYSPPRTRPGRPAVLDVEALNEWTAANQRAKNAYYGDQTLTEIYALRIKASEKQMRYRRRSA